MSKLWDFESQLIYTNVLIYTLISNKTSTQRSMQLICYILTSYEQINNLPAALTGRLLKRYLSCLCFRILVICSFKVIVKIK